jgi:hypothetical protein
VIARLRPGRNPVLDGETRHCGEVGICSHDRTLTERQSDRGDHHVDLLHMKASAMPVFTVAPIAFMNSASF